MENVSGWVVVTTLALLLLTVLGLTVALVRLRRRARLVAELAAADAASLRDRLEAIERRLEAPVRRDEHEYVVTMLGRDGDGTDVDAERPEPATAVPGPLFADLVLRESVVQAASLAAGLRRALSPEHRNRIRFEMKREVKRARKQRRADLRQAKREFEARQRARSGESGAEAA